MNLKPGNNFRIDFLASENIEKVVLHKYIAKKTAEMAHNIVLVAAILDFAHTGHQGAKPPCLRWFLKTLCPYLTLCQVTESCHQVPNSYEYGHIPSPLRPYFWQPRYLCWAAQDRSK